MRGTNGLSDPIKFWNMKWIESGTFWEPREYLRERTGVSREGPEAPTMTTTCCWVFGRSICGAGFISCTLKVAEGATISWKFSMGDVPLLPRKSIMRASEPRYS